jgi:hypothetical protein
VVDGLRCLRVQPAEPLAHPALHRVAAKPNALFADSAPVPCRDTRPQITGPPAKTVDLWSLAELFLTRQVHTEAQKPSPTLTGGTGLKAGPAVSRLRGQYTHVRFDCGVPRPCSIPQRRAGVVPVHDHRNRSPRARGSVYPTTKDSGIYKPSRALPVS